MQSIEESQEHQYQDDEQYLHDHDNDHVIVNKKSHTQRPFTE